MLHFGKTKEWLVRATWASCFPEQPYEILGRIIRPRGCLESLNSVRSCQVRVAAIQIVMRQGYGRISARVAETDLVVLWQNVFRAEQRPQCLGPLFQVQVYFSGCRNNALETGLEVLLPIASKIFTWRVGRGGGGRGDIMNNGMVQTLSIGSPDYLYVVFFWCSMWLNDRVETRHEYSNFYSMPV